MAVAGLKRDEIVNWFFEEKNQQYFRCGKQKYPHKGANKRTVIA
jgi:hypothetical protein